VAHFKQPWHRALALLAAALWWGSLTALGAWVVPTLFAKLETARLAGSLAAHLFSAQSMASAACAVLLLMVLQRPGFKESEENSHFAGVGAQSDAIIFVVSGLFLALLLEVGVAPKIVARSQLALWHTVGVALLVAQWLCAAAVLWAVANSAPLKRPAA
jgi:Domain of unknown function (DUF4149)